MPILVSRLARLIEAADAFIRRDRHHTETLTHIQQTCAHVTQGHMSADDAVRSIVFTILSRSLAHEPAEAVIAEERTKYNLNIKRNIVERERLRAHRAGEMFVNQFPVYKNTGDEKLPPVKPHDSIGPTDADLDLGGQPDYLAQYEQQQLASMTLEERQRYKQLLAERAAQRAKEENNG